jgi:hypothetical protein
LRTLAVEVPVGLVCLWALTRREPEAEPEPEQAAWWRMVLVLAGCSLITHPFAWWGNRALVDTMVFAWRAAIVEAAVVIVEGAVLRYALGLRSTIAWGTALAMNAASFGYGVWLITRG